MPSFDVNWNATNTASATVPMGSLFAPAAQNVAIYEINAGSDASADNAVKYALLRTTARGTQSTALTPIDVSGQGATAAATFDTAWNINPTITASSWVLQFGMHQRATYRWVAYDYTKTLRAIGAKGIVLMSVVVSSAFNAVFSLGYDE